MLSVSDRPRGVLLAVDSAGGDRSPGAIRRPAMMESVDRWPLAILPARFLGGAALREPPFVGVSAGSGPSTRGPHAAAWQRPRGRPARITCVRTGSEGFSGGNWMVAVRSRYAGGAAAAGRSFVPS